MAMRKNPKARGKRAKRAMKDLVPPERKARAAKGGTLSTPQTPTATGISGLMEEEGKVSIFPDKYGRT